MNLRLTTYLSVENDMKTNSVKSAFTYKPITF